MSAVTAHGSKSERNSPRLTVTLPTSLLLYFFRSQLKCSDMQVFLSYVILHPFAFYFLPCHLAHSVIVFAINLIFMYHSIRLQDP